MNIKRWEGKVKNNPYISREVFNMRKIINEKKFSGLNKQKKELLRSLMGKASSKEIDFNKVRDEWRYGINKL